MPLLFINHEFGIHFTKTEKSGYVFIWMWQRVIKEYRRGIVYSQTIGNHKYLWILFYFLDIGAGLVSSGDLDLTVRLGIHLEPGKRFQLRSAYNAYIRTGLFTSIKIIESTDSFLTVSIGYRFGKTQNKLKGNNSF